SPAAPAAPAAPAPAFSRPRVGIAPRVTQPPSVFSPSAGPVRIQRREGVENAPGRHYWHESGGRRYTHYYDGRVHWYGYPYGASFFWTRPYGDFWWRWDVRFSRWAYWNDGFWWWLGPGGVQFVYIDDNYYPYDTVRPAAASSSPAPPSGALGSWPSPDGSRLVEVTGADAQAILYDKTREAPAYIAFLGAGAQKVRFSSAAPGSPSTIAVEFRNGSLAIFDYDGRRLDTAKPAAVKTAPPAGDVPPAPPGEPPAPEDLPPPP
ncbi:MAG: hypothetical protein PHS14_14630, partial [Elusimicrobia bacterium]|nr:hypothetical protein [Elusimicrobiota bacterium]